MAPSPCRYSNRLGCGAAYRGRRLRLQSSDVAERFSLKGAQLCGVPRDLRKLQVPLSVCGMDDVMRGRGICGGCGQNTAPKMNTRLTTTWWREGAGPVLQVGGGGSHDTAHHMGGFKVMPGQGNFNQNT